MSRRVAVTGMAGISPIGNDWATIRARLGEYRNAVVRMADWEDYEGLNTRLGAPAAPFELTPRYNRKAIRSMGRVALMATRASELALQDAGLLEHPLLQSGDMGVSFGSSAGTPSAIGDFGRMMEERTTKGINATTYIKMMSHTAPVNIGVFFGITGRVITTSSACTSGSQGIGYAYEAIRAGKQLAMVAGGAEELCATEAAVFDTLFATSTRNDAGHTTPRPFDAGRDGLVIGEGTGCLIVEDLEHAQQRGATIYAELVGFGTNSDGCHVTQPNAATMQTAMRLALRDAGLQPHDIGYVNAHGTGTVENDRVEGRVFAAELPGVPFHSIKAATGHTLGAAGAIEAAVTVACLELGRIPAHIWDGHPDPALPALQWVRSGDTLKKPCLMSNSFAFGGNNVSLIIAEAP